MLTTHANKPRENAPNAPNGLLATNPPGYTRGRLGAEQTGGEVSSRGREQSSGFSTFAEADEYRARADAADPLKPGQARFVDEDGKVTIVHVGERWEEAMERIQRRLGL